MLQRILGRDVRLVSGGHAVAAAVQRTLERARPRPPTDGEGAYRFLCTGDADCFRELGTRFLQMPLGEVEQVEITEPPDDRGYPYRRWSDPRAGAGEPATAMKAGDRERAGALRMIVDALQKDAKLRRRRRGRGAPARAQEAARGRRGLRARRAAPSRRRPRASRRELIEAYLPQQLSDEELAALVDAAVAETGAERAEADGQGDVGADAEGRRARRRQAGQRGGA